VVEIDYKDVAALSVAMSLNGTIRRRNELCRRHQSQLDRAVKRARFMGLLVHAPPARAIEWPPRKRRRAKGSEA
jgi:ribosomal protein S18